MVLIAQYFAEHTYNKIIEHLNEVYRFYINRIKFIPGCVNQPGLSTIEHFVETVHEKCIVIPITEQYCNGLVVTNHLRVMLIIYYSC